jgi:hypothetical protein
VQAREILHALLVRGGRLQVDDEGRLGVFPASVLTDELRTAVRAHRDELRELVQVREQPVKAPIDQLDDDWRACKVRAQEGFRRAGTRSAWGLDGATALELDLLDRRRILEAVYAGRLVAILGTDGRAVVFQRETGGSA